MSKLVGNTTYVLAHLFNTASRQYQDIWASQCSFLYNVHDTVPHIEACLYGHFNWPLVQAIHQPSLGLSQSSDFMRCARVKPKDRFMFNVQVCPLLVSGGTILALKPYLNTRTESHQNGRKSAGVHIPVPLTLRRRGTKGYSIPGGL